MEQPVPSLVGKCKVNGETYGEIVSGGDRSVLCYGWISVGYATQFIQG